MHFFLCSMQPAPPPLISPSVSFEHFVNSVFTFLRIAASLCKRGGLSFRVGHGPVARHSHRDQKWGRLAALAANLTCSLNKKQSAMQHGFNFLILSNNCTLNRSISDCHSPLKEYTDHKKCDFFYFTVCFLETFPFPCQNMWQMKQQSQTVLWLAIGFEVLYLAIAILVFTLLTLIRL